MTTPPFDELLGDVRIVPVITVTDERAAVGLARALVAGGLPVLEVTLRTPAGLPAITRIAGEVEGAIVGAGTVTTPAQLLAAREAGARFIVSPGCTDALLDAAAWGGGAFLPGVATASEVLRVLEHEISLMKFFPAESSGGIAALRALGGPFPEARFCPTGGIDAELAPRYLALPNVACVGGSWMVPGEAITRGDWAAIQALAAEASGRALPGMVRGSTNPPQPALSSP
ncbi:MAG TPA: bifunctional 4-hydroxy-2-oxoglutarate aldolase/2-dehydro-3-deoxy-phosphogluconate aldolase [Solirubrobacteraceae bacterium]|nr:bifunctional 4-hydroxy-2-oxoglutarate aldolase/2-dehydro-3-deoxy-phosphogluconate aldolase [Solirubrobacteraceae bacterium]